MVAYLLKLTLCWGLFALLYATVLRTETFFRLNRAYLLLTAMAGLWLPFAGSLLPAAAQDAQTAVFSLPLVDIGLRQAEQMARGFTWSTGLWVLYGAGAAVAGLRTMLGLVRIARMTLQGAGSALPDGCRLVRTREARMPFSFFKWIFVPLDFQEDDAERHAMLAHERAHAHGWHSADVLLAELLTCVFWFHPLAHWYRRALREVHEYLADREAADVTNRKQYSLLLIRQAQPGMALQLAHHFFQSPLKQRLMMLTKETSAPARGWKYALIAPVLGLLLLSFQAAPPQNQTVETPIEAFQAGVMPEFPGGQAELMKYLAASIKYPALARAAKVQGVVVLEFIVEKDGTVSGITDYKKKKAAQENSPSSGAAEIDPAYEALVQEATRVTAAMPRWKPGEAEGKPARARMMLPIRFKLE